jgi:hypothetical protein
MKFATGVNFIKLFYSLAESPESKLRQNADSGVNYAQESFMKLASVNFIKLFSA